MVDRELSKDMDHVPYAQHTHIHTHRNTRTHTHTQKHTHTHTYTQATCSSSTADADAYVCECPNGFVGAQCGTLDYGAYADIVSRLYAHSTKTKRNCAKP
jgi:hypothetical protein